MKSSQVEKAAVRELIKQLRESARDSAKEAREFKADAKRFADKFRFDDAVRSLSEANFCLGAEATLLFCADEVAALLKSSGCEAGPGRK